MSKGERTVSENRGGGKKKKFIRDGLMLRKVNKERDQTHGGCCKAQLFRRLFPIESGFWIFD